MTQDLHMLKEKNKNKCIYSSMLSPFTKVDDEFNFKPKIFIQINLGKENQKSGIDEEDLESFYQKCVNEYNLNIIGIMCLPPFDEDPTPFFKKMQNLSESLKLKEISMGMSNDYMDALRFKATFIRVGSKIFGNRS